MASLGTAVSYSTNGGGSEAGGGSVVSGRSGGGGGSRVGWSRTETRLLMALVDAEAKNAQAPVHGGMRVGRGSGR
jgi:hypothetical protein